VDTPLPEIETILLSVGVTFLASGIITFIFYPLEKDIVTNVQNEMKNSIDVMMGSFDDFNDVASEKFDNFNDVTSKKFDIIKDCHTCDIVRIFENRRYSEDFANCLSKCFKGKKIFMMGTTLKDFFSKDAPYKQLFMDALKSKNTQIIAILLLDPKSNAALDAAAIDHGEEYRNKDKYEDSGLYDDLKNVTKFLYELSSDYGDKLNIKYTNKLPHTFMLKVESFSFIEYYDLGNLSVIDKENILDKHQLAKSMGGYTPIFFVKNYSNFSKLIVSYLENELENNNNKTILQVAKELGISEVN